MSSKGSVPDWVSGQHETIAVRVSEHPTVVELCNGLGHCLTSTSANISTRKSLLILPKFAMNLVLK